MPLELLDTQKGGFPRKPRSQKSSLRCAVLPRRHVISLYRSLQIEGNVARVQLPTTSRVKEMARYKSNVLGKDRSWLAA